MTEKSFSTDERLEGAVIPEGRVAAIVAERIRGLSPWEAYVQGAFDVLAGRE